MDTKSNHQQTLLATNHVAKTLYHFTSKRAAKAILTQGLRENWVLDMPKEVFGMMRGVWLTDDSQLPPKFSTSAECRIEVAIPCDDVRLVQWRSILQERIAPSILARIYLETPELSTFYFYFGNVDVASIRCSERYSTLQAMRECRRAHFERLDELGIE